GRTPRWSVAEATPPGGFRCSLPPSSLRQTLRATKPVESHARRQLPTTCGAGATLLSTTAVLVMLTVSQITQLSDPENVDDEAFVS
ncbi:unnamed protein product, partial [Musa acuminata subsp. burmannicoides]